MSNYIEIAFKSRGLPYNEAYTPMCEWCNKRKACDIDHLFGRGGKRNIDNRMYDPYNLMFICRKCHQNKGGRERKQKAKEIVKSKIVGYSAINS